MEFYIANGALEIHGDLIRAVGCHATMQHKAVVAQLHKTGSHILGFRAAQIVAAAGDQDQVALGLAGILHQIGDQERPEVSIVLSLGGKLALHICRQDGHILAPDEQRFLSVGDDLNQLLTGLLGV